MFVRKRVHNPAMFGRELTALLILKDVPGVIQLRSYDTRTQIFDLPYVPAGDFLSWMQHTPLRSRKWSTMREIITQTLETLALIHGKGIAHADISPDNILMTDPGVVLSDFGLARRRIPTGHRSKVAGKGPYMAPEVQTGTVVDWARADMWSLGAVLYGWLTNRFLPLIIVHDSAWPTEARMLLHGLLVPAAERWTAGQCLRELRSHEPNNKNTP